MDHSSLEEALSCRHRMHDDRPFGSTDHAEFEQVSIRRRTDERGEAVVDVVRADRVAEGMQDRLACETVLECTVGDNRLLDTASKLPC
jgi:hypothetical protein